MALFNRKQQINAKLSIEDKGEGRINRLAQAATSKTTLQQVVELAWTAGPVTLVASIGGYYMGHGKALPKETLIFFIAYTIIAGLIGLAAHLFNRLTRDRKQELVQAQLARVIGDLPDRIIELRDLYLATLDPEARRLEGARIILEDVDLGPRWFASAVRSAGGSEQLAFAAEEIELYRRAGMPRLARDIHEANQEELEALVEMLASTAPALAHSLRQRFEGYRPGPKQGVQRTAYFIERIFAAIDDDDDTLMTLDDVEEMFTLLFELLCGRRIPMLSFNYIGNWQLARATDTLEKERLKFRIVRAQGYSRLLALASHLSRFGDSGSPSNVRGLSGPELLAFCTEQIDHRVAQLDAMRVSQQRGEFVSPRRLALNWQILEKALELYHLAFIANRKTDQEYANFLQEIKQWRNKLLKQPSTEIEIDDGAGAGGRGLQIIEDEIYLSDKPKLRVVAELYEDFRHLSTPNGAAPDSHKRLQAAKQLAIRIALILDQEIGLNRPEAQRAIYNANSLSMGVFESDLSTKTKIGWGEALAKEIEKDMRRASEALVRAIYRYYGLKLNPRAQKLLTERYGASPEKLQAIYGSDATEPFSLHAAQPAPPFRIPKAPLHWRLTLNQSRAALRSQ